MSRQFDYKLKRRVCVFLHQSLLTLRLRTTENIDDHFFQFRNLVVSRKFKVREVMLDTLET
jgi:hypothetical protein